MSWRKARSLDVLYAEINGLWPDRDHASDGFIGDPAHLAQGRPVYNAAGYTISGSDHNPDDHDVVCAFDIDTGPGIDIPSVVNAIIAEPDPRLDYLIWNRRIYSSRLGTAPWTWRPYGGSDPHVNHVHLSVRHGAIADNTTPWALSSAPPVHQEAADVGYVLIRSRTTHRIASTNYIETRALGGKQSAAAQQSMKDHLGHVIITDIDEDVFDALLAGNADVNT